MILRLRNSVYPLILGLTLSVTNLSVAKDYNGAEIRTIESFLYGKFEVKMKTVEKSGMLCSFFTFYDNPDFVSNWNEIDIEILGRYNNEVQFNTITPGPEGRVPHEKRHVLSYNPHEDLHTYAIVWVPEYIAFEVDGKEVYRDTGAHIKDMNRPQKLMMNIWSTEWTGWTGEWTGDNLPVKGVYEYVKYYSYDKGSKKLNLEWSDDFDEFDGGRWQWATHSFDGNLVQFTPNNGRFEDGKLELVLSKSGDALESSTNVVKKKGAAKLESGSIKKNKVNLVFSQKLSKTEASNVANYSISSGKVVKAKAVTDYSTDKQTITLICEGELNKPLKITVSNLKDKSGKELKEMNISIE